MIQHTQILVPSSLHNTVLKQLHDYAGHFGVRKTMGKVRERFYWPGYESDVERYVRERVQCQRRNPAFVQDVHSKSKRAFEQTRDKLSTCQERRKETHDRDSRGAQFKVGDRVWLYVPAIKPGKTKKLSSLWRGPYTVLDKTSPVNYSIQLIGVTTAVTVHRNRLKPCYGGPNQMIPRPKHQTHPNTTHSTSAPMSYRDALLTFPVPPAGYTSSDSIGAPNNDLPSRPVRNRQPPERYGIYIQH